MIILAHVALLGWPLVVVLLFLALPPRKAVINSFVFGYLFLPNFGYGLPGLPDYTKESGTVASVLLCALLFDQARVFAFRIRRLDVPMLAWCVGAFVTTLVNGLTPYDGLSLVIVESVRWGLPYLIGRIYLTDMDGMKELAEAIAIGGICYIPLCLFEIRFSPVLQAWVYGFSGWEGLRLGGYRPKVFLQHGLALGLWMANASVACYALWSFGTTRAIRGVSMGKLTLALIATTVFCRSTGATGLMALTLGTLWAAKRFKRALPIRLMLALPLLYCTTRSLDLWSGRDIVELAKVTVGEERARSFEYRLEMEKLLLAKAYERPIFGWGGFNRFQAVDDKGNTISVPDGFWVIAVGTLGLMGLSSMIALFILPTILALSRFPVARWSDPQAGSAIALALMLLMTLIDFLSNAMVSPIYPLAIGGLLGQRTYRPVAEHGEGEAEGALALASELAAEGRMVEAAGEFDRAIGLSSAGEGPESRRVLAEALDGLGHAHLASGRLEEATSAFGEALVIRDGLAAEFPDDARFRDLAIAREGLSRALAEAGRVAEAIEERQISLRTWEILEANHPRVVEFRERRVDALNDLAWLLATDPCYPPRDPARALELAEESARIAPAHHASWNTLGVARYRAGDWAGAIEALERSATSSPGGVGTAFDHYFLAMAWCRLRHPDQAGEWLERGIAWAARNRPGHPALARFRGEAESLLRDHQGADLV